jgi:Deoxyxylulose-5-phosphate synthase
LNNFLKVASGYHTVVIVEDGIKSGGIGEELKAFLLENHYFAVSNMGFPETFLSQGSREQILENAFLSPNDIQKEALGVLNENYFSGK